MKELMVSKFSMTLVKVKMRLLININMLTRRKWVSEQLPRPLQAKCSNIGWCKNGMKLLESTRIRMKKYFLVPPLQLRNLMLKKLKFKIQKMSNTLISYSFVQNMRKWRSPRPLSLCGL